jgi:hypothetical protein
MQTVQQGNGAPSSVTRIVQDGPEVPAPEHGNLRVSVAREGIARRPSALLRSPSNSGLPAETAAMVLADVDEVLVEDTRAGVTPAEMVEQKLRSLLRTRGISIELSGRANPVRGRLFRQ